MPTESDSLDFSFRIIQKNPLIILPFIFCIIIGYILSITIDVIFALINSFILPYLANLILLQVDYFVFLFITHAIWFFFVVFAFYWQSYASSDQIENGNFSFSATLSDTVTSWFTIIAIALFVSFVYTLFYIIPYIGPEIISNLFLAGALISVIMTIYNRKGYLVNIVEMPDRLYNYYKHEPITGFILLIIILLFIVPNELLMGLGFFLLAILGSLILKFMTDKNYESS